MFVLAAALVATTIASSASAALFFLIKPTTAQSGELVTIRLGGTPASFTLARRERPYRNGIRIYLRPSSVAGDVRSRFDRRLSFVGRIVPDKNFRGLLTFRVPPLDTGAYVIAAWCPGCARNSFGKSFFVQTVPRVSRYRESMGLQIRLPPATADSCPVTESRAPSERYGNGLLSTRVEPFGTLSLKTNPSGRLSTKLGWLPHRSLRGDLVVRGERLDAPGRMRVLGVNWGYASSGPAAHGSWASAVEFPSEGCWRISGRVGDVSLTYVVKVVGT